MKIFLALPLFFIITCGLIRPVKKDEPARQPVSEKPAKQETKSTGRTAKKQKTMKARPVPEVTKKKTRDSEAEEQGQEGPYALTVVDSASLGNEIVLVREKLLMENGLSSSDAKTAKPDAVKKGKGPSKKKVKILQGYKIQVYATTNFKEAERKKYDLMSSIDKIPSVIYEAPYYKIRMGNFEKEEDAKPLKKQLEELGYDAWIVKSRVRIKK
jgi:cell division protein FtsN